MKTKRSTFKVLFYLKRTAARVSDGKAPVMARITIDGDIATFSAKLFVTPSLWNAEAGKVNGKSAEAVEINPQLEEIKARINNHYYQILRADDFVTSEKVRNAFFRYRRDGELHPERLPDHEQGIWRHGGKETPCKVHL